MKPHWFARIPVLRVYRALDEARRELRRGRKETKALKAELRESRLKRRTILDDLAALKADHRRLKIKHRELEGDVTALNARLERTSVTASQRALALESLATPDIQLLTSPVIEDQRLQALVLEHADAYRTAQPFPHIVLDGLFSPRLLDRVLEEFERMDRGRWHQADALQERKWSTENPRELGPFTAALIAQLNGGAFVGFLEDLTGIRGLLPDPHLRGGGLHEIRPGGLLGVHADFNMHSRLGVYRRLNLLVYLNKEWQEGWGGALELWDRGGQRCVRTIPPVFNRAVLFDTSNSSYHGHPHALACPSDRSRKSVALYYYTVDYPYDEDRAAHTTIFIDNAIT